MDNLLEYLENIRLLELNEPKIGNVISISDFQMEEDIYVDLNDPLNLPWNNDK